jgi:hypothetical protein
MAVTVDEEQVFHMIADAQLTVIENHGRGPFFDLSLLFAGAALGLAKDFVGVASKIYARSPVDLGDGVAAVVFVATAASGLAFYLAARQSRETVETICAQIRARTPQRG